MTTAYLANWVATGLLLVASLRPQPDRMGDRDGDVPWNTDPVHGRAVLDLAVFVMTACVTTFKQMARPFGVMTAVALLTCVAGFLLRMWCFHTLGKYFTFRLGIRGNHQLITTGPYRYLVHPSYTGQLMVLLSWLYLMNLPLALNIAVIAYMVYRLSMRIYQEESMMYEHFGRAYLEYHERRNLLIPFKLLHQ